MPLPDRPDFQAWLKRFEARHEQLHGAEPGPPPERCDGCGEPLAPPASSTGLCLVCLAELYGRDQSRAASRIAGALRVALTLERDVPLDSIREAVDEVLAEHEGDELDP